MNRCKVGVRCRPPFEDELDDDGMFTSAVTCVSSTHDTTSGNAGAAARVEIHFKDDTVRDFGVDWAFGPEDDQSVVYNQLAGPIVHDALNGKHGALFAYGQTGTGKTYTMGILDRVTHSSNGIVPRALSHVFGHAAQHTEKEWTITASFVQIYLENVQDLMAPTNQISEDRPTPATSTTSNVDPLRLHIREDPQHGFFMEGVTKYHLSSFGDAVEFVNYGLENRAMAPTLMNTTSSRSHTILTLEIHQRPRHKEVSGEDDNDNDDVHGGDGKTMFSKLLLIDLAGSERVRRTTSKGRRLEEAKSINVSLSALGNVVAALADPQQRLTHVPYRDSKLTKLTADVLAGNANAALIATVGPAVPNISETLSTMLFASRCMDVELHNVEQNEIVDYPALCRQLQGRLREMQQHTVDREQRKKEQYEHLIRTMASKIQALEKGDVSSGSNWLGLGATVTIPTPHQQVQAQTQAQTRTVNSTSSTTETASSSESMDLVRRSYLALTSTLTVLSVLLAERAQMANDRELERQTYVDKVEAATIQPPTTTAQRNNVHRAAALEQAYSLTNPMEMSSLYAYHHQNGVPDVKSVLEQFTQDVNEHGPLSREEWSVHYSSVHPKIEQHLQSNNPLQQLHEAMNMYQQRIVLYADVLSAISKSEQDALKEARTHLSSMIVEQEKHEQDVVNWSKILQQLEKNGSSSDHLKNMSVRSSNKSSSSTSSSNSISSISSNNNNNNNNNTSGENRGKSSIAVNSSSSSAMHSVTMSWVKGDIHELNKVSLPNYNSVPGMLPAEVVVDEVGAEGERDDKEEAGDEDFNRGEDDNAEFEESESDMLASEEEKSLYQRQIEAKERLVRHQNHQAYLALAKKRSEPLPQPSQRNVQLKPQPQPQPNQQTAITTNSNTLTNQYTTTTTTSFQDVKQTTTGTTMPAARTFFVTIEKTAKRAEEGLGLMWGQRRKQEEIHLESNILNQMYVVFVRRVLKHGNASSTIIKNKNVLVSIDGEDVMGCTINFIHSILDDVDIGTSVTLEFFEEGTNMSQPVYAPRVEFEEEGEFDELEEDDDEEREEEVAVETDFERVEHGRMPKSPGLFLLGSPEYSQLRSQSNSNTTVAQQRKRNPPPAKPSAESPEYSQFQKATATRPPPTTSSSSSPPPPPSSSMGGNTTLLDEFHTQAKQHHYQQQQQQQQHQQQRRNMKVNRNILLTLTQEKEKEEEKEEAKEEAKEEEEEWVTPYTRSVLTSTNIRSGDTGGWLMRKRKDLNGKWEAQYFKMDNSTRTTTASTSTTSPTMRSYCLLSHKGTVDLSHPKVSIHDVSKSGNGSKFAISTKEMEKHPYLLAIVSPLLATPLVLSASTEAQKHRWIHALKWIVQSSSARHGKGQSSRSSSHISRGTNQGKGKRRKSMTERALTKVMEEGLMCKKSVSTTLGTTLDFLRSWNQRFFKLHADTLVLEYYDVKSYDAWCCNAHLHRARTTLLNVHREAVEDGINPIWFQKQCRFTLEMYERYEAESDEESEKESLVDLGTNSDAIRRVWLSALDETAEFDEDEGGEGENKHYASHGNVVLPSSVHQRIGSGEPFVVGARA